MKEKGILFKPEMIKAILEGRKTQTRRVAKPQPYKISYMENAPIDYDLTKEDWKPWKIETHEGESKSITCPYPVGTKLYVKETWCNSHKHAKYEQDKGSPEQYLYKLDYIEDIESAKLYSWKSPLFMPKSAARIWLEVTSRRVERVQDISESDATTEGITLPDFTIDMGIGVTESPLPSDVFRCLWEDINESQSWGLNPYVWVYEFKLLDL